MELQRCRICGEVYYGGKPTHCPYCGAHERFLVPVENWQEENIGVEISPETKERLEQARELEFFNTRFYRAAAETKNPELHGYFKYLTRIEAEHYSVLTKLAGEEKSADILGKEQPKDSDSQNLEFSEERETKASNLYKQFAEETPERRVKEVFKELSEIESDHLALDVLELNRLKSSQTA